MASRIIHLAIGKSIEQIIGVTDSNRFSLGCILPDVYSSKATSEHNTHYKEKVCNGTKKTYNLDKFRTQFQNKLLDDDLYLGYYLHLIQDIVYREFVYKDYQWNPMISGNVKALHNDYALLNAYVIEKYKLVNNIVVPLKFEVERINNLYSFEMGRLVDDLKFDFQPYKKGDIFFLTENMVDEYIDRAVQMCIDEVKALRNGKPLLNALDYAWK